MVGVGMVCEKTRARALSPLFSPLSLTWAALYLASSCFCDASTWADACRILMRSPCISLTVCSSIFSGSSAAETEEWRRRVVLCV